MPRAGGTVEGPETLRKAVMRAEKTSVNFRLSYPAALKPAFFSGRQSHPNATVSPYAQLFQLAQTEKLPTMHRMLNT